MAFVGLGIFMMTPKLLEMIQEALKVPAFKYGSAMGEALQFGWKPFGQTASNMGGAAVKLGKQRAYEGVRSTMGGRNATPARVLEAAGWKRG